MRIGGSSETETCKPAVECKDPGVAISASWFPSRDPNCPLPAVVADLRKKRNRAEPCGSARWSSSLAIVAVLAFDASAGATHYRGDFFQRQHAGVAAGRLGESAVGGAEVDSAVSAEVIEEAVDQAGGKAVAAADAVLDLQLLVLAALVELAVIVQDGRPVVDQAGKGPRGGSCRRRRCWGCQPPRAGPSSCTVRRAAW